MEAMMALLLGIGLSAACGFRVFVPLLALSLFAGSGHMELASGFEWIGSPAAMIAFAVATVVEISAYYIPWVDNALDSIATPTAVVAGTVVTASVFTDASPLLQWSLAIIAGGGAAGAVQSLTVGTRAGSSVVTAGLGNWVVSTGEAVFSTVLSVMAIVVPVVAVAVAGVVAFFGLRAGYRLLRRLFSRPKQSARGAVQDTEHPLRSAFQNGSAA